MFPIKEVRQPNSEEMEVFGSYSRGRMPMDEHVNILNELKAEGKVLIVFEGDSKKQITRKGDVLRVLIKRRGIHPLIQVRTDNVNPDLIKMLITAKQN